MDEPEQEKVQPPVAETEKKEEESSSPPTTTTPQTTFVSMVELKDLREKDLRQLFTIVKRDHPEVLASSLSQLVIEEDDDDNLNEEEKKIDTATTHRFTPPVGAGEGCYLHYEASSAKLKLQYSKTPIPNAIGFYSSYTIPAFKYKRNFGRADLIGNCASGVAGRKNYYSGWCQFLRQARAALKSEVDGRKKGVLYIYPRQPGQQGLDVDIYVHDNTAPTQTSLLPENMPLQHIICSVESIACLPKHSDIFLDVRQMDMNRWLVEANGIGATSRMSDTTGSAGSSSGVTSSYSVDDYAPATTMEDWLAKETDAKNSDSYDEDYDDDDSEVEVPDGQEEVEGCYLLYNADAAKLTLQYSRTFVKNAIGFYCAGPGKTLQAFKFKKNFGRADLIGNCASGVAGRKNYYSGWCQFIRAARAVSGPLWMYPRSENQQGLDVDIYVYYKDPEELGLGEFQTVKLNENEKLDISNIDAVSCLPQYTDFFEELKKVDLNRWLTEGNTIGASSRF